MNKKSLKALQNRRENHLGKYFIALNKMFVKSTVTYLHSNGFTDITPHHIHILSYIDTSGTSVADILVRSDIKKQALSNTLNVLTANGYIYKTSSIDDARSKFIQFTDKGLALLHCGLEAIEHVEGHYADKLGEKPFAELKVALGKLV